MKICNFTVNLAVNNYFSCASKTLEEDLTSNNTEN